MASRRRLESLLILGVIAASLRAFAGCSGDNANPATAGNEDASTDAKVAADASRPPSGACADAGAPPMRACTSKQCSQLVGEPAACVGDQCVKLKTPECQGLSGAVDDNNAIWIGSLINLSGADTQNGLIRQHSVELAVKEINAAGGLYTANGCGRLPIAYLSCDDSNTLTNPDAGPEGGALDRRAAAKHLAEELKVAGIMGAYNSNNTIEVALNVTDPAKTLLVAPTAGASDITTIANATADGARLVWRTVPTDALQAKAIATYGAAVEKEINKGSPLRAAIVNRGDAFGNGLRDGVKAAIMLNGMSWAQNAAATPSRVLELSYVPAMVATQAPGFVAQLTAFQPDIIFWFGLGEFVPNITVPYENSSPTTKPIWISSGSGQRSELIAACATKPTLKARSRGTSPQVTTPLAQDFFNFRYKATYQDAPQLIFGQTQAYDATYLIAYAAQATKPTFAPVSSVEVARNMAKMVGGSMAVDVGPTGLKTALEALRAGQTIDFTGASGPLDFDPAVGEAPGDYAVWCVRTDPNTNAPAYENVTGMIWRYKTNALDGTYACPP